MVYVTTTVNSHVMIGKENYRKGNVEEKYKINSSSKGRRRIFSLIGVGNLVNRWEEPLYFVYPSSTPTLL